MTSTIGWIGTALVLLSYAQSDVVRLRRVSLLASVALITFNVMLGIWSNIALEVALVGINLAGLRRVRLAERAGRAAHGRPAGRARRIRGPQAGRWRRRGRRTRRMGDAGSAEPAQAAPAPSMG